MTESIKIAKELLQVSMA